MPVQLDHPGVYIEEVPSGVRTITGVATSVTAFVGRAQRGPTDDADRRHQLRRLRAQLRRAVAAQPARLLGARLLPQRRLAGCDRAAVPVHAGRAIAAGQREARLWARCDCEALDPGAWGNSLRARVDFETRDPDPTLGETGTSLFNLYVRDGTDRRAGGAPQRRRDADRPPALRDERLDEPVPARDRHDAPGAAPAGRRAATRPDAGKTVWDDNATATNSKVTGAANTADDGVAITNADFIGAGLEARQAGAVLAGEDRPRSTCWSSRRTRTPTASTRRS